ncbi:MAG: hypothetical protein AAF698_08345 [Pseudomonadota bacterium]
MIDTFLMVGGVLLLAATWMVAIARMIENRRWSPLRPAVMVVVIAACLIAMGDAMLHYMQHGEVGAMFYLAAWNLGMALFDMKIALVLAQRGEIENSAVLQAGRPAPGVGNAEARAAYEASPAAAAPAAVSAAPAQVPTAA